LRNLFADSPAFERTHEYGKQLLIFFRAERYFGETSSLRDVLWVSISFIETEVARDVPSNEMFRNETFCSNTHLASSVSVDALN